MRRTIAQTIAGIIVAGTICAGAITSTLNASSWLDGEITGEVLAQGYEAKLDYKCEIESVTLPEGTTWSSCAGVATNFRHLGVSQARTDGLFGYIKADGDNTFRELYIPSHTLNRTRVFSDGTSPHLFLIEDSSSNYFTECYSRLAVVKNFITRVGETDGKYIISEEDIEYPLRNEASDRGPEVCGSLVGSNGWIGMFAGQYGLLRVNASTLEIAVVESSLKINRFEEERMIGFSSDGKLAVVQTSASDTRLIEIDSNCMRRDMVLRSEWRYMDKQRCQSLSLEEPWERITGQVLYGGIIESRLSGDGKELVAIGQYHPVFPWARMKVKMIIPTSDQAEEQLQYLAMGDSISSGEGDIEKNKFGLKYYRIHTNSEGSPKEKCHLSTRSYPYLLAQDMDLTRDVPKQWDSVACSGAKSVDMYAKGYGFLYQGQEDRLKGIKNEEALQADALNEFIPGRIEQIEFVKKYKPKVITLTMGANTIKFSDKLKVCLFEPQTCIWASSKLSSLAGEIKGQYSELKSLYEALYEASDRQAKIYVIGYPQLISRDRTAVCTGGASALNWPERQMIYNATEYFNLVIKRAANAAGVAYVDISGALEGGRLCDKEQSYVNGILAATGDGAQESFHPNSKGHEQIRDAVHRTLGTKNLSGYYICSGNATRCPQTGGSAEVPDVPESLGGKAKNSRSADITDSPAVKGKSQPYEIAPKTLKPGSQFDASYYSEPTRMGTYTAGLDGGAVLNIAIPSSLSAGFHTFVIEGVSYSGEPIELTQTVLIYGKDQNDIDENGVKDSLQPCGPFMSMTEDGCGVVEDRSYAAVRGGQESVWSSDVEGAVVDEAGDSRSGDISTKGNRVDNTVGFRRQDSLEGGNRDFMLPWYLIGGLAGLAIIRGIILKIRRAK